MDRIYLDHNATTPLDPRVLEAMRPWLEGGYGNASSLHWFGQRARAAVDGARAQVAALVGAAPAEVVFTSGGTEADNLALRGVAAAAEPARHELVVSAVEHPAVLNTAKALAREGFAVAVAPVDATGRLDLEALAGQVDDSTALVSVMLANNETGVLQPVAEAAALARAMGALVHCDAVQAAGKVPVDVAALGCDLLSLSAHKIYGPQGMGALVVRRGTSMQALLRGGSQERNRRAGTENVAGVGGLRPRRRARPVRARGRSRAPRRPAPTAGEPSPRHPRRFGQRRGASRAQYHERLLRGRRRRGPAHGPGPRRDRGLDRSGLRGRGHRAVSRARGHGPPPERVRASLRFSLGRGTNEDSVATAAAAVTEAVHAQRRSGTPSGRS